MGDDLKVDSSGGASPAYQVGSSGKEGDAVPVGATFEDGQSTSGGESTKGTPSPTNPSLPSSRHVDVKMKFKDVEESLVIAHALKREGIKSGGIASLQGAGFNVQITETSQEMRKTQKEMKDYGAKQTNQARTEQRDSVIETSQNIKDRGTIEQTKFDDLARMEYYSGGAKIGTAVATPLIAGRWGSSRADDIGASGAARATIVSEQTTIYSRSAQGVGDGISSIIDAQKQTFQGTAAFETSAKDARAEVLRDARETSGKWMDSQSKYMNEEEIGRTADGIMQAGSTIQGALKF